MEFQPFWELLEKLGIALPDPSRIKETQRGKPTNSRMRMISAASRSDKAAELLNLLVAMEEAASPEDEDRDADSPLTAQSDWVLPSETVQVAGYDIPGMVYVGEGLAAIRHFGMEPCLIRPSLKVDRRHPDTEGQQMSYGLSYSHMRAGSRAAYLQWLAGGRRDPATHSGYVWLFFYGLERRVLHDFLNIDLQADLAKGEELDQIRAEVMQLQEIYGNPGSNMGFGHKAEMFLEICRLIRSPDLSDQAIDPFQAKLFALQVGLGQKIKQGQPLPADWALAWYTRLANQPLPTAATRCLDEFKTLFRLRYAQHYGEGMKLKPGKVKLTTNYYPANPSFGRSVEVSVGGLPDVSRFTAKLTKIAELVYECRMELDPLSRLLGRNPGAHETPAAIALLPADLLATHGGDVLKRLQKWLNQLFAKPTTQVAVVSGKELFKYWSGSNPEKLTKTEASGLSHCLAQLGYGLEPDPHFGAASLTFKSNLALFRLPPNPPSVLSAAYFDATLLGHLAIAVASGEDAPSFVEQQYLETHLANVVNLEPAERSRLQAHLQGLLNQKPTLRNLKTRIERIELERAAIARFLVQVTAADGQVNPKEVQLLEKAYLLLDLDPQTLYSDIHDLSTTSAASYPATQPVTVRAAKSNQGFQIPSKPKPKEPQMSLDMALVQSKLVESQEISNLLADIFAEEEGVAMATDHTATQQKKSNRKQSKPSRPQSQPTIAGLDASHSELLLALTQQRIWQREALEPIATKLNLMLDGALEVINEVAFDRCDAALVEEHDAIEVDVDVLRELLS
jgi:hypothetical protein